MPSDFIDYVSGDVINYVTMTDEHEIVLINEKTVTVGDIGMIVRGDVNSQEVEFEINRKYDNVDLLGKDFYIIFKKFLLIFLTYFLVKNTIIYTYNIVFI